MFISIDTVIVTKHDNVPVSSRSPRRRIYPPAWKPYGLEAEPEARAGVKLETGLRLGEIMGT